MNKLLLFLIVCLSVITVQAQNDSKYLSGAVPEKDGRVYFAKEINAKNLSKKEIYDVVSGWAKLKFIPEKDFRRQLTLDTLNESALFALGDDYLVFQDTPLSLDRVRLLYNFRIDCVDGACSIKMYRLFYSYKTAQSDMPEQFTAEEMISDKNALNKNGKIIKGAKKFRVKTIDYVNNMYDDIESLLGKAALRK